MINLGEKPDVEALREPGGDWLNSPETSVMDKAVLQDWYAEQSPHYMIVAVIPAYNEERFIGSVVLRARKYVSQVVVVDDGSDDATTEIAEEAGALVLKHPQNRGKGAALNTGFRKARELNAEVVVLLDGDGQHRPEDIPLLVHPILRNNFDMVIGSRYLGLNSDVPLYRRFGQVMVTLLTNASSGVKSTDSWSGFRAFSSRALDFLEFQEVGWGVDPEFQFQAREHSLLVGEVPIVALYREKAKRNPVPHGVKTVNAILRMVGQHRPLLFFGASGSIFVLLGLIAGVWVYQRLQQTGVLAAGITMLSVLLLIVGVLTVYTGIILHSIRAAIIDLKRKGH
jgi:glycosyltransferase involved in cell wall biosynthesis